MAHKRWSREAVFVASTIGVTLLVAWLSSLFAWGWPSAFALALGMFAVLAGYAYLAKDPFLYKLLLFGITAGLMELMADCWLVHETGTLVYPNDEPMIACSPLYMPFAWAVVLVQVGYLGWLISRRERMWETVAITFGIGVVFIPIFEHLANGAGWWYYQGVPMVFNTPYYIILGEGLLCAVLPILFSIEAHRKTWLAVAFGIGHGLWIWAAYFIGYQVLG